MKRGLCLLLAVCVSLLLLDCRTTVPTAPTAPHRGVPAAFRQTEDGALVHEWSDAVFPQTIAGFTRDRIHVFDREGRDVGVNYLLDSPAALLSIYVYPNAIGPADATTLQKHFVQLKAEIEQYKQVTSYEEREIQHPFPWGPSPGRMALLTYTDKGVEHLSFAYLFARNTWFIYYRISYPITRALTPQAAREINEQILRSFDCTRINRAGDRPPGRSGRLGGTGPEGAKA